MLASTYSLGLTWVVSIPVAFIVLLLFSNMMQGLFESNSKIVKKLIVDVNYRLWVFALYNTVVYWNTCIIGEWIYLLLMSYKSGLSLYVSDICNVLWKYFILRTLLFKLHCCYRLNETFYQFCYWNWCNFWKLAKLLVFLFCSFGFSNSHEFRALHLLLL